MECLQNVESIDVPVGNNSKFQVITHPEAERVVNETHAWIRALAKESGCEDPDGEVEHLIAGKPALLACRFYPFSPNANLTRTFAKIMMWFFGFDNVMDEPRMLGADSEACQQFCGFILQTFFSMQSSQALAGVDLLPARISSRHRIMPTLALTMIPDWWAELRAGMSTRQQARFCSFFSDYVLVHARQAWFRQENKVPEMEEYLKIRIVGAAMCVVEILAEQDCGIELDEEELMHPSMRRLHDAMGKHAGLLNDYIGFSHEYDDKDYFNMLTVLHYHNNERAKREQKGPVPFQKTCREAWETITALEEECVVQARAVREWALKRSKPALAKYVDCLCAVSAANWLSSVDSPRFTASNARGRPAPEPYAEPMVRVPLTPLGQVA